MKNKTWLIVTFIMRTMGVRSSPHKCCIIVGRCQGESVSFLFVSREGVPSEREEVPRTSGDDYNENGTT
jgi:hypothetical protein